MNFNKSECVQLMADGNKLAALECIRKELQPLGVCRDRLHHITAALMCGDVDDLQAHLAWSGPSAEGRISVLTTLQVRLSCLYRKHLRISALMQHTPLTSIVRA